MSGRFEITILALFFFSTSMLALYGLHLYALVYYFRRRFRGVREKQREIVTQFFNETPADSWPGVTSQIPIYNEADVADRVIDAVAAMAYPRHRVQVLDDSTDGTKEIVDAAVLRWRARGVQIDVVRRPDRRGFKAGALGVGLELSEHPYVAVFDADFVPPRDFLRRAVPLLEADSKLACLQGRWAHLNAEESWITKAQSVGIDGHFAIEQGARAWNGLLMNFNGTAGIWRKAAIEDPAVGGWSADTLTEDLDLSYRAQLAGWRINYCLDLACPAELPNTLNALKAQQRRWATGSIQTAVKLLPRIWRAPLRFGQKLEATIHLTHYSVAFWMLILAILARPMLLLVKPSHFAGWFAAGWCLVIVGALAPTAAYTYGRHVLGGGWTGLWAAPSMLMLGAGLTINNAIAVIRGLWQRGGQFARTPKSGSNKGQKRSSRYVPQTLRWMWLSELGLGVYCLVSWGAYIFMDRFAFSIFLGIYAAAFLLVGAMSAQEARAASKLAREDAELLPKPAAMGPCKAERHEVAVPMASGAASEPS